MDTNRKFLYIADTVYRSVWKIYYPNGFDNNPIIPTLYVGTLTPGTPQSGRVANTTSIGYPSAMDVDPVSGDLFLSVSDPSNPYVCRISGTTQILTLFTSGYICTGIRIHSNLVYLADQDTGRIRSYFFNGSVNAIEAGNGVTSRTDGDGDLATKASLGDILGIAIDRYTHDLYWSNLAGHIRVRKQGIVSTVVTPTTTFLASQPIGIECFSKNGNTSIAIASSDKNTIGLVEAKTNATFSMLLAGLGSSFSPIFPVLGTDIVLRSPASVWTDPDQEWFVVTDFNGNRCLFGRFVPAESIGHESTGGLQTSSSGQFGPNRIISLQQGEVVRLAWPLLFLYTFVTLSVCLGVCS